MHNTSFLDIYHDFNGVERRSARQGHGPGNLFEVRDSRPAPTRHGLAGRVVMPAARAGRGEAEANSWAAASAARGHPVAAAQDYEDKKLGLPRDLNGNNVIDTSNHSSDYLLLPVRIEIKWKGIAGPRSMEILTQLSDMRLEDEG
jgi:hypothetical protein